MTSVMNNIKRPQMGGLFRKSLLDLVKGLRTHKDDESAFINQCLSEIKEEVKQSDHDIKACAILKLAYLYMIGYDISFSHFHIVEVMSQPSFQHRRIAYLAAALSFTEDTDVILLTTHHFKKSCKNQGGGADMRADGYVYESGQATNCLANICTPALAETLLEDVYGMMNSSKPYVRKKAVLVLYSIFKKFPRALPLSFNRLKEKLNDEDPGVQNAAVNVICELARRNPKNYLGLLPQLCELLNNSNNNWMLIKLVKLLGSLIPAEPRLGRKLHEPLTHIITNTPAKSLLYECINTATNCEQMSKAMIRLCLDKLRTFVEDPDQNLKYLGLLGLNKIMRHNIKAVAQHRDLILACLDDPDQTIRMRALDLITSMVNEKNLEAIIRRLTDHLYGTDGNYREHVLEQMITVCSKSDYEYVRDFAWYVELLTNMTGLSSMGKRNAELIATQLKDVTIRVPEVREFSVEQMEGIIVNNGLIGDIHNMASNSICRILLAASYIVGEFSKFVKQHLTLVCAMLQTRIASLEADIQCVFIHNALKVVCAGLQKYLEDCENDESDDDDSDDDDDDDSEGDSDDDNNKTKGEKTKKEAKPKTEKEKRMRAFKKCSDLVDGSIRLLEPLSHSRFIEVQERATSYLHFLKWMSGVFSMDGNHNNNENDNINMNNNNGDNVENKMSEDLINNNNNILDNIAEMTDERWNESLDIIDSFSQVFGTELMPVHADAQAVIAKKIPKGLDLDKWIGEEWPESESEGGESDDLRNYDDEEDDWFGSMPETKQKRRERDAEQVNRLKAERKQRQQSEYYLGDEMDGGAGGRNEDDLDDRSDNEEDSINSKKRRKGKKKKGDKLTDEDILNAPVKREDKSLGLTVGPKKKGQKKRKSNKAFTVIKGVETVPGLDKSKKNKNKSKKELLADELAADMDFTSTTDIIMPTLQPYKQDSSNIDAVAKSHHIVKDENGNDDSNTNDDKKKKKDKKNKKDKKKGKKGKKGGKDELEDEKQLSDYDPSEKQKKKDKKKKDKKNKKKGKEQNETDDVTTTTTNGDNTQQQQPSDILDMFDFGGGGGGNTNAPASTTKTNANSNVDSILGLGFGNEEANGTTVSNGNADSNNNDDNEEKTTKKAKKKKSKKHKNEAVESSSSSSSSSAHVFHSDDNISITYNARPGNKKSVLKVSFTVKNNSEKAFELVELTPGKSGNMKLAKKDTKKVTLCSDLECGNESTETISFKCKNYSANEKVTCQLSYQFENTKSKKAIKIDDIELKLGTWAFVMDAQNSFENENELKEFVDNEENNCQSTVKKIIKLPDTRTFADALDTLVKVWRVEIVASSAKKAIYYGRLLLDKHIAIWVKTSEKKHALQVEIRCNEEDWGNAMLDEIKEILVG